ncbi:MAG: hypothetical protein JW917_05665 [Ignavibacteria bacterium]|nr:hypothetical protein [Ignavibacteria bacterium]
MRTKLNIFLVCLLVVFLFFSCSKDTEEIKSDVTTEEVSEFTESNDDFLTVDYDYFYKELSPHGEWIEVSAKDIGIEIKPEETSLEGESTSGFLSDILGVKTVYAQTGEELFNLFVWRPANELAETMIEESSVKEYTPYLNGQWVYTDEGWYFKANTPQEDLTCHYGRWSQDEELGWVWLPGKTYSPAWVDWRQNEDYVAWAPIPPGTYIENEAVNVKEQINENRYTIVEKKSMTEPSVYKYRYQYVENKNKIMIKEMTKTDGVMIKEKTVINKGPDVSDIEKKTGKKIEQVKIKKVKTKEESGISKDGINVYTPEIKKSKEKKNVPVSKPEKLVSYKDAKKITKEDKGELKEEDKVQKKEEKEMKQEQKQEQKEMKKEEKEMKQEQNEMKKEDKQQGKDKDKNTGKDDKSKDNKKDGDNKGKDDGSKKDKGKN